MTPRVPTDGARFDRRRWMASVAALTCSAPTAIGQEAAPGPAVSGPAAQAPPVIDDFELETTLASRLGRIGAAGGCLDFGTILEQSERRMCRLKLAPAGDKALAPGDVYRRAIASTLLLAGVGRSPGSLRRRFRLDVTGTAFVISADGAAVTNWHIFEGGDGLSFGMANRRGTVYPITEVLAADPAKDIAIVRLKGDKFTPLPLSVDEPVGAWLGVLGHPGGKYFTFTQGRLTRYAREHRGEEPEDWLQTDADFAVGSSGAPALNKFAAAVGMATMTEPIAAEGRPRDFPQQMVAKSCIPAKTILGMIAAIAE